MKNDDTANEGLQSKMAGGEEGGPSPRPSDSDPVIVTPTPNDVLFGRGKGVAQHPANMIFRELVRQRKEAYNDAHTNRVKNRIAREIFDCIHSNGGRFLRPLDIKQQSSGDIDDGVWRETENAAALEKCKQALREKQPPPSRLNEGRREGNESLDAIVAAGLPISPNRDTAPPPTQMMQATPVLPSTAYGSLTTSLAIRRLEMMQYSMANPTFLSQLNSSLQGQLHPSRSTLGAIITSELSGSDSHFDPSRERARGRPYSADLAGGSMGQTDFSVHTGVPPLSARAAASALSERESSFGSGYQTGGPLDSSDEASDFLTFCVQASDQPFFTEEQAARERATLTEEEKVDALSDMYGRKCTISTHQSKRPKRDLDASSIRLLVNQMRVELEAVPLNKKRALLEAQRKCHAEEFSDARLEQFLRCEGMNAQLAAQRFVNYWEARRELFGPEKYLLRMTLSEALRDDLVALETCLLNPLPHLDSSGRQLMFIEPCRHTKQGYTSESMQRAVWYILEVAAQRNVDLGGKGLVFIRWDKNTTIWDFDFALYGRLPRFEKNCWPIRMAAMHLCSSAWFVTRIFKPIMEALSDKRTRSRIQIHDTTESKILEVLSSYGILPHMLPTEMGGSVRINQSEWIASRRAAEMEEI